VARVGESEGRRPSGLNVLDDIRFALRTFAKQPSFAAAAIATLALGMAVNTLVFSLVNSLVLRPMPVRDASRVVRVYPADETGRTANLFSFADFSDYRAAALSFETLAAYIPADMTAGRSSLDRTASVPRAVLGYIASASYFDVTGVRAAAGRLLQPADDRSRERVAVISDALWRERLNADPYAIGAMLTLNGTPFTIVGVAEPRFAGTEPLVADVWVPISTLNTADPDAPPFERRASAAFLVVGRLARGVARARAADELTVIARRLAASYPGVDRPAAVRVVRGAFFYLDPGLKPVVAGVMAVVGLVLLIACANVANLMLARAAARQREIAVRLAIGAGRARIVRQLIAESLVLSVTAGIAALLLAGWALRALYVIGAGMAPFPWAMALDLTPDIRVFGYTFGLATAGGALLALAPSLQASSPHIVRALHGQANALAGRLRGSTLRHALVVVQIAASVVLLVAAGLLLHGLRSAEALDLGFSARGAVYAEYNLRAAGYGAARAAAFNAAVVETARQIPGVTAAAVTSHVPLHGGVRRAVVRFGTGDTSGAAVTLVSVSPEYFDVLRVGFVAGRNFSGDDLRGSSSAIVISDGLARRFWPGDIALGKTLTSAKWPLPRTIVGVVRDASAAAIWRDKEMAVYLPAQASDAMDVQLIVRTNGDESTVARELTARAARIDPDLRFQAIPVGELLRLWMLPSRVAAAGAATLAVLALLLASIGLYGVLTFSVGQRLRELGIRMALGANPRAVVTMILRDAWRLVWRGVSIGGVCALAAAPLLGRMLFGVRPVDPLTLAAVAVVLAVVAFAAAYVPARRAARLDPVVVLRVE
jgi:macrolide transport system ATP-binding/permease protein